MKRPAIVLTVALLLLFVALTLFKHHAGEETARGAAGGDVTAGAVRTGEFWQLYRQATDERVAGNASGAAAAYVKALELNPRHEDALYYLGNMYMTLGRYADADSSWERLVAVNPQSARAHSRLGDLHFCLRPGAPVDLARAEAEYRRAHEINGDETGPLLRLGEIALVRGNRSTARYYLDAVLGTSAGSVDAHFLEGYLAWRGGELKRAAALFGRAVELARPRGPAVAVSNEGDTKRGDTPLTAPGTECDPFHAEAAALSAPPPPAPAPERSAQMQDWYRRLDAEIDGYRRPRP